MKNLLAICVILFGMDLQAQTTTIRSQGNNVGNGGAYVAPVTTKTYSTPSSPNKPYVTPGKTYNYNSTPSSSPGSNNSSSSPAPSGSSGMGGTYRPEEPRPDFGYKFKSSVDEAIQPAIKNHSWDTAFALFELPAYDFENRAQGGGGKDHAAYLLVEELTKLSGRDYSLLPLMYKAIYVKKLYWSYPVFSSIAPQYFLTDLAAGAFVANNSCLYMGDYQNALRNLRAHTMYGASKPWIKKKKESYAGEYENQEQARNYINYMAGRCFQQLGMADSAKKYLSLGQGCEATWDKLYTEGAAARAARDGR